jgi:serine/threonine-protein kinase
VLQVCDAVGEAHAQGIVHRDLKPENVMLVRRGEVEDFVKVLDFGIARLNWGDKSMATQAGLIFGTAKYISPEGAEGVAVGPPADVYSIATILYQCLAGPTRGPSGARSSPRCARAGCRPRRSWRGRRCSTRRRRAS